MTIKKKATEQNVINSQKRLSLKLILKTELHSTTGIYYILHLNLTIPI
jgi:hypothetical protein